MLQHVTASWSGRAARPCFDPELACSTPVDGVRRGDPRERAPHGADERGLAPAFWCGVGQPTWGEAPESRLSGKQRGANGVAGGNRMSLRPAVVPASLRALASTSPAREDAPPRTTSRSCSGASLGSRVDDRAVQDRAGQAAGSVVDRRTGRDRHPRVGRLVQPPLPAQHLRRHPARRTRSRPLPSPPAHPEPVHPNHSSGHAGAVQSPGPSARQRAPVARNQGANRSPHPHRSPSPPAPTTAARSASSPCSPPRSRPTRRPRTRCLPVATSLTSHAEAALT